MTDLERTSRLLRVEVTDMLFECIRNLTAREIEVLSGLASLASSQSPFMDQHLYEFGSSVYNTIDLDKLQAVKRALEKHKIMNEKIVAEKAKRDEKRAKKRTKHRR